ncbi:PREDICTED: granzyme E-like [Chlamydotis macqueenii]|nr:PREDICTED: granzyme E-like [Chlamydotis macqueenii]
MEYLQKLLLSLLLVPYPPAKANYPWNRMEGGGKAKTRSTPYVAYLQGKNNHFCGGFLVAPNWVMTAAQCFMHKPLTVILGAHTIQRREESWQIFEVQEYHCHPDFMSAKKGNDILLLKLKGNATSNSYVRTISFEKSKVPGGTECSIVGWGYKTPADTLREAAVTIIRQRDCLSHYPGLTDNLICGRSGPARAPEKGDAGDPLICNNKAYGIFSYRHNNWPGFYTHIAPFLPWVNGIMKSA